MTTIAIEKLALADARELAPLIAAYVQDMKRGAPRRPDEYYAEMLLTDRAAELLGAWIEGRLVGFAVFYDLPDAMTGMRLGQLDHIFVTHEERNRGIARGLIDALKQEGRRRGWLSLRWTVPAKTPSPPRLVEALAVPAPSKSFLIEIERAPTVQG